MYFANFDHELKAGLFLHSDKLNNLVRTKCFYCISSADYTHLRMPVSSRFIVNF